MEHLKETHYYNLPSQGNIYTISHLEASNGPHKLLVATLKRDIFYIEYQETAGGLIPMTKEVSFTYIPSGAEIISLDAFNKSSHKNEFVIGVTIIKNSSATSIFECYLNIYSEWEENEGFNIDNIAQDCLIVELTFIPYHLTHTELYTYENGQIVKREIVFLLSGSDSLVHIYREHSTDHSYKEVEHKDFFPELTKTPSPVVWIQVYVNATERLIALACECGYLRLTKLCLLTKHLVFMVSTRFDSFIAQVSFFPTKFEREGPLNLIVVNTVLPPILFKDVSKFGLSLYVTLPRHDVSSVLSCCQVADVDFDGEEEILIGNGSEEILLYKKDSQGWCLKELKTFTSPIISLKYLDLRDDGVKELVVLSMKGVHFLQHDFEYVDHVLREKI